MEGVSHLQDDQVGVFRSVRGQAVQVGSRIPHGKTKREGASGFLASADRHGTGSRTQKIVQVLAGTYPIRRPSWYMLTVS